MLEQQVCWQWPSRALLQISDCHLLSEQSAQYRGVQPYNHLARLLDAYRAAPLPLVLTGDLSEDHSVASYQRLRELLEDWPAPVYLLPGNHDDLSLMQQLFTQAPFVFAHSVVASNWTFLLLDTRSGTPAGAFDATRQQQLARSLANHQQAYVWLFCHHHPKPIGGIIDTMGQQDADALNRMLDASPQVKGLSHGHCHHGYVRQQANWQIVGCPASSIQYLPVNDWVSVNAGPQACYYQFKDDGAVQIQFIALAAESDQ